MLGGVGDTDVDGGRRAGISPDTAVGLDGSDPGRDQNGVVEMVETQMVDRLTNVLLGLGRPTEGKVKTLFWF